MKQAKQSMVAVMIFAAMFFSASAAKAECGIASYYWQGKVTANGERYNPDGISAAHKTLPFGTRVRVTHQRNGRSMVVRINDRGPFIRGRIIDLSRGANRVFGMDGIAPVCISVISRGDGRYVGHGRRGAKKQRLVQNPSRRMTRVASLGRKKTVFARGRTLRTAALPPRNMKKAAPRKLRAARIQPARRLRQAVVHENGFGWPS